MSRLQRVLIATAFVSAGLLMVTVIVVIYGFTRILFQEEQNDALKEALGAGDMSSAQALLEAGADPNTPMYPNGWFRDRFILHQGAPIIFSSLRDGDVAEAQLLIDYGAEVDGVLDEGWVPFLVAANNGHLGVVQVLIDAGADPNVASRYGYTPLHCAAYYGYHDVVRALLEAGADPNAVNKHGHTPLHKAAAGWVPAPPTAGRSYSHNWRNAGHHPEVIALLLAAGARLDATDAEGKTPCDCALAEGRQDLAPLVELAEAE